MPWFKVDDKIHSHPKARRAGLAAMGLWALAGSHCMDYLTDGVVESWFVESWPDGQHLAARLVDVGLWDTHPDGWVFHDWGEYQPTRAKVIAEREATKERVEKHRQKRAGNAVTNGVGSGVGTTAPSPSPSPDFYSPSKSQSSSNRARVSTDPIAIPEMTRKLAARRGVSNLRSVVDAIVRHTGVTVDANGALQVALWILDKAKTAPSAPQRYVTGAIAKSPLEVQQFIHENALEVAS